ESTLITHGFPHPQNLEIARKIEQTVRDNGVIPATIAILHGKITVGLTAEQLETLANDPHARKCSVRDLPLVLAQKKNGATTVAATMTIAHRAGIAVFATGGIGGGHRGSRFDISADLMELGKTPVTVVCAGMKAFLDLPDTLEYLETQAVPVLGYQTDELPAFYSRSSGLPVDARVDSAADVAEVIAARDALDLSQAILVTVPVPTKAEWKADAAKAVIAQAQAEIETTGISGKNITPYMLAKIAELSGEESMRANIALLLNNARVGAEIARALAAH
ncbi:MAG TPA: pseudouridine-5'-phosphate glycosidase, partial [Anaerolineae bacterium]|nr:pseudouridine-5'-phosphate glycosidase [Anaerolineae bacterium]